MMESLASLKLPTQQSKSISGPVDIYIYLPRLPPGLKRSWKETQRWLRGYYYLYSEGQCEICIIGHHIKAFELNSTPTVIMTSWLNLGIDISPAKYDPLLMLHTVRYCDTDSKLLHTKRGFLPRLCFEAAASQPFAEMNSRNLLHIRDRRYRQTMRFESGFNVNPRNGSGGMPYWSDTWYTSSIQPSKKRSVLENLQCQICHL